MRKMRKAIFLIYFLFFNGVKILNSHFSIKKSPLTIFYLFFFCKNLLIKIHIFFIRNSHFIIFGFNDIFKLKSAVLININTLETLMGMQIGQEKRDIVIKFYLEELKTTEIARMLNCNRTSISRIISMFKESGKMSTEKRVGTRRNILNEDHNL
ncbi:hypothetical protein DMUE_4578 [Dictyocoela muelleri]|nr:hypothetical protein DMUE_4578 [Dictyocoela muelleri]